MAKIKEHESDYYTSLLNNDIEDSRIEYLFNSYEFISNSFGVIVTIYTITKIHYWVLVTGIIMTVLPIIFNSIMGKYALKINKAKSSANESYLSRLQECIRGFDVIKRSNRSDEYVKVFKAANDNRSHALKKYSMLSNMTTMLTINQVLIIGVCAFLVVKNLISAGMIITEMGALGNFGDCIANALEYRMGMKASKVFSDKFVPYLCAETEISKSSTATTVPKANAPTISIQNLGFSYDDHKIFNNFNLDIEENRSIAILGPSASGKSTLINLLLKTFDGFTGDINYYGKSINDIAENELYDKVCLVPQNSFIFKANLFDNITMFRKNDENTEIRFKNALSTVNMQDFYTLHEESELNPEEMSGGEKKTSFYRKSAV